MFASDGTDIYQLLRIPGKWDDGVPGVWHNHHRFYLPEYGVYGRRDPIFRIDGNAFSYAGGNPVMAVDPLGLWPGPAGSSPDGSYEASVYAGGAAAIGSIGNALGSAGNTLGNAGAGLET